MVYYFTSDVVQPPVTLFMGFDKHESECEEVEDVISCKLTIYLFQMRTS